MYSFEGEFRKTPEQNLAGASRKENKNELIYRAQLERLKRQENRHKHLNAIRIQSSVRSYFTRKKVCAHYRHEFDLGVNELGQHMLCDTDFMLLLQKFLFFYEKKYDFLRLEWISRYILKHNETLLVKLCQLDPVSKYRLHRILYLNLEYLVLKSDVRELIATPLRLFEVFTSRETLEKCLTSQEATSILVQLYTYLIKKNYIKIMRSLLDDRTPPLLEASPKPPTPLAECLLTMIKKVLLLVNQANDNEFSQLLMIEFCMNIMCCKLSEAVKWFLLPALIEFYEFPCSQLLHTINTNAIPQTIYLLFTILTIGKNLLFEQPSLVLDYLQILARLTYNLTLIKNKNALDPDSDEEEEEENEKVLVISKEEQMLLKESADLLNHDNIAVGLFNAISDHKELPYLQATSQICHNLLMSNKLAVYSYKILFSLSMRKDFLSELWKLILHTTRRSLFDTPIPLLTVLSRGLTMTHEETHRIVPLLATFCSLFSLFISTLHDAEFYNDSNESVSRLERMGFSLPTLIEMILRLKEVSLGLVELAFPESTFTVKDHYQTIVQTEKITSDSTYMWNHLFKACVSLLRQLYARDLRRTFCPEDHWIAKSLQLSLDNPSDLQMRRGRLRMHYRLFQNLPSFTREELEEGVPLSTKEIRTLTILREVPFVLPFTERVKVFNNLVLKDKFVHQNPNHHFLLDSNIKLQVRRNYLYEDAFEKLSPDNEPELRLAMRIRMISAVGLDEAGVDGGGIFRDFLSELLKTSFDPNRGFFKMTKDNLLYPNPFVELIHPNYVQHYYFIGRMLGKALYENLLVELPLAEFFLSKLVNRTSDVDVHHLASLDSVMYKNLLYLKNYEGNVADLGLDFTVVNDEFGETSVTELKPNGTNIPVTASNRIEYIHLVADYKLNKQIHSQCLAFKRGVANLIAPEWMQMFSNKEMQVLISGAQIPVDVQDLREHTCYTGYTPDHLTIVMFWQVLEEFDDIKRRQLLKFVTSCSRPPLLGFKNLVPPFCILHGGTSERLPTASTCMNLLKLPEFQDKSILKEKLLYAIQSNSGFELS